jgi:Peptidase C26
VGLTAIPPVAVTFDVDELEKFVLWRETFRGLRRRRHRADRRPHRRARGARQARAGDLPGSSVAHVACGGALVADVERDVPDAVARAVDHLVEAVELPDEPVVGVQWHPEVLWYMSAHAMNLLRGFAAECVQSRGTTLIGANRAQTDR